MCSGVKLTDVLFYPRLMRYRKQEASGLQGHPDAHGWVTKEPTSHLFMDTILELWPEAVFIYLTRHPLDMAFSNNQKQLHDWSWFFDIDIDSMACIEAAQLEYWIRSERRLRTIMKAFGSRVYNLKFKAFALNPQTELSALTDALGIRAEHGDIAKAVSNVTSPKTIGRWHKHDLSRFSSRQPLRLPGPWLANRVIHAAPLHQNEDHLVCRRFPAWAERHLVLSAGVTEQCQKPALVMHKTCFTVMK